jgi:hypothetical protein
MWAQKRIDGLMKAADRDGSRDAVLPEIIDSESGFDRHGIYLLPRPGE